MRYNSEDVARTPLSGKKLDLLVLLGFTGLEFIIIYLFRNLFIGRPLIVFAFLTVATTVYLGLREKKNWKKILLGTLILGPIFGFFLEFICEYTLAYSVTSRVFESKILGVLPLDNLIGHAEMVLLTIVIYEHFVDDEKRREISSNILFSILPALFAITVLLGVYFTKPDFLLRLNHPYFYLGLVAITPPVLLAIKKPNMIKKMIITASYFFVLYFVMEMYAVSYDWWVYTGDNYIGWLTIFGRTFPLEEFFFWIMFYAASLVSYYEIFIDDLR